MSNNSNSSSTSAGGVSACTILLIVFVILKLTHLINWPWIWVLCPLWIPIAGIMIVILMIGLISGIANRINKK